MNDILLVLIIVYCCVCGYFTGKIAEQKKYSFNTWAFIGFLFNAVALIAIGFYEVNPFPDDDETQNES
jgi:uncharacterized membrane protein YoaK (UPF0700 family)